MRLAGIVALLVATCVLAAPARAGRGWRIFQRAPRPPPTPAQQLAGKLALAEGPIVNLEWATRITSRSHFVDARMLEVWEINRGVGLLQDALRFARAQGLPEEGVARGMRRLLDATRAPFSRRFYVRQGTPPGWLEDFHTAQRNLAELSQLLSPRR